MNLLELKKAVDTAVEMTAEEGNDPGDVRVSIQVDLPTAWPVFSADVDLHYDGDGDASGCVIVGPMKEHKTSAVYRTHFRAIFLQDSGGAELVESELFENRFIISQNPSGPGSWIEGSSASEDFNGGAIELLKEIISNHGTATIEVLGELWAEHYRCGNPMDGEEWDCDYEFKNLLIQVSPFAAGESILNDQEEHAIHQEV